MTEQKAGHEVDMPRGVSAPPSRLLAIQRGVVKITRAIDLSVLGLASLLLVFMTFALFVQVLFRYVVKQPAPWTEEGARFALVWLSMAAATIAAREGQHFVFRWATLILPRRVRYWLRRVVDLSVIALLVIIFSQSLSYLDVVANQTAPGTGLNMRFPYAGITFGAATLIAIYIGDFADALLSQVTGVTLSRREAQETSVYALLAMPSDSEALR